MSETVDEILALFFDELQQTNTRYQHFINQAEKAGFPHLARLFRAVVASETARANLYHTGLVSHASDNIDYFICPHCGLIFIPDAPETCPVDGTPGATFEKIS